MGSFKLHAVEELTTGRMKMQVRKKEVNARIDR